uniref:BHLH domain-containing protein n=1 Tax=Gadus morhua TaxID=8049 RepID=A0A8C4YYY4_GADMO
MQYRERIRNQRSIQSPFVSHDHSTLDSVKPLVEKLRRERINSSIEQLKSLLGPEFLKQEPDSKMEKADILEMTVDFLRQLQLSWASLGPPPSWAPRIRLLYPPFSAPLCLL